VVNASELFKAGQLQEAIAAQVPEVKRDPGDPNKRLFLFELLAFAGDLERARRQIDAVQYADAELDAAVQAYRQALDAEDARRRLLRDGLAPQFLAEPPAHIRLRLEAVNRLREQRPAEAAELLEIADTARPALRGQLNGRPFASLRDCDDLFAAVLEVVAHGVYYWVPLEQIDSLSLQPPQYPRDLIWFPGRLQVRSGPAGDVFLPALYPGSHEHPDDRVKLGRMTDWKPTEQGPVLGVGLRTFLVDEDDLSLLEWRELQMG
jgi:type VI secretion system protein ImpE